MSVFKSLLQDYVDTRQVLHKPLSTSTGTNHNAVILEMFTQNCLKILHFNHIDILY